MSQMSSFLFKSLSLESESGEEEEEEVRDDGRRHAVAVVVAEGVVASAGGRREPRGTAARSRPDCEEEAFPGASSVGERAATSSYT